MNYLRTLMDSLPEGDMKDTVMDMTMPEMELLLERVMVTAQEQEKKRLEEAAEPFDDDLFQIQCLTFSPYSATIQYMGFSLSMRCDMEYTGCTKHNGHVMAYYAHQWRLEYEAKGTGAIYGDQQEGIR